jgi:hypothetical protein
LNGGKEERKEKLNLKKKYGSYHRPCFSCCFCLIRAFGAWMLRIDDVIYQKEILKELKVIKSTTKTLKRQELTSKWMTNYENRHLKA